MALNVGVSSLLSDSSGAILVLASLLVPCRFPDLACGHRAAEIEQERRCVLQWDSGVVGHLMKRTEHLILVSVLCDPCSLMYEGSSRGAGWLVAPDGGRRVVLNAVALVQVFGYLWDGNVWWDPLRIASVA